MHTPHDHTDHSAFGEFLFYYYDMIHSIYYEGTNEGNKGFMNVLYGCPYMSVNRDVLHGFGRSTHRRLNVTKALVQHISH